MELIALILGFLSGCLLLTMKVTGNFVVKILWKVFSISLTVLSAICICKNIGLI